MVTWCKNLIRFLALIVFQCSFLKQFPIIKTVCLVVNRIIIGNLAFLFNCTPVGRTSDSMMISMRW